MAYVHTIKKTRKGISSYCAKRDEQIYRFTMRGWSRRELAEKYHLTEQRIGQIISKIESASRKKAKKSA